VQAPPSKFQKLNKQLEDIAIRFDLDHDELIRLFEATCCDFGALEEYLMNNNTERFWNPLEDMAIWLEKNTVEYKYLLDTKGKLEIARRR